MCGTSYFVHIVASSSTLGEENKEIKPVAKCACGEVVTEVTLPVRDPRGKAGSCGVNTQDVLGSQFLDLLLHCLQVGAQLVALQDVLHHHRLKTWNEIEGCESGCHSFLIPIIYED